jgi:hypothetical protein
MVLTPSKQQKLLWALQIAEAVDYIHSPDVLHCNLNAKNVLLDEELSIKLCDFQGKLLNAGGSVQCDGGCHEDLFSASG